MRFNIDDRGIRYCDIFTKICKGDINITIVESGACALWHRHKFQSDYQLVIKGSLKIGMCNLPNTNTNFDKYEYDINKQNVSKKMFNEWQTEYKNICLNSMKSEHFSTEFDQKLVKNEPYCKWVYLSEKNANKGALFIPAGLWHGAYNYTNEQAILIYHITNKYDNENPDEERCDVKVMGWEYERIIK